MHESPFISVVIPTYNRQSRVVQAIESVLAQTYRHLEIIVIDDGSTDATEELVRALISKHPAEPRIRYLQQENSGPSAARNTGIREAAGTWIGFLDSDDIWMPDKLQCQVHAIERFGDHCGACFTDARLTDSRGLDTTAFRKMGLRYAEATGIVEDSVRPLARAFGSIWVQTVIARRELIEMIGGFDSNVKFGEDHDFLFRLALLTPYCYANAPLVEIDRSTAAINPAVPARQWDHVEFRLEAYQYMHEKWLRLKDEYPEDVIRIITQNLRGVHSGWANWYLENARFEDARRAAARGLHYEVTPQLILKWVLTRIVPHIARRIVPRTAGML